MTFNIADALNYAEAGRTDQALAMLEAAAEHGNVDALMQLAVWSLTGHLVPQDHQRARALLRRAVSIGHVDGAMMEIALTANGTGNEADWPEARRLLAEAAANDYVAAAHKTLLDRMALEPDGSPATVVESRLLHADPRVVYLPDFLTPDECAHIAMVGGQLLEPARVIDPATGRWARHSIRTSDNAAIGPAREDLVVRAINLRIAAASGTDVTQGEPLTILRYQPGQEYRPHLDTIAGAANQRIRTVLIYLNGGFRGGETSFPLLNLTVIPRGGDALMFDTLLPDGVPNPRAQHAGTPVIEGVKWLATRWIRTAPIDPWSLSAH
ncbi:proline hydroxylase [Sphingomonas koreensis]|uniref:2OG-Fe(II) oxygenase n=1 Tax=Sphingomonas koreensis TaxID=93064 RepID=UPI000830FF33|nr:2OG-Fe(II) oxygenase [Sphingomonas koreensis]PJI87739.1 prolyl 4-hydroxylase [Sphingomonas koreensis]RSU58244.1 proline hydroxylase [Sphingomonas koreensis]RSU71803.1 proline hydroxylase [Sphingomonas koreensis]